jgi:hypothetical protein
MTSEDPWFDPRPTDEIIASLLANPDRDDESYEDDRYWPNVGVICHRLTPDVLARAVTLCESSCAVEQRLGCDILGGLGEPDHPFWDESVGPMLRVLDGADELETIGIAIANLGRLCHPGAAPTLLRFVNHPDDGIRYSVATALPRLADAPGVIGALIVLTRDWDVDVRDWATFGLGSQTDADGPDIRSALWERTTDPVAIVRAEALCGLARRKVPGTLEALEEEAGRSKVGHPVIDAAEELGGPRGVRILERLQERFPDWDDVTRALCRLGSA